MTTLTELLPVCRRLGIKPLQVIQYSTVSPLEMATYYDIINTAFAHHFRIFLECVFLPMLYDTLLGRICYLSLFMACTVIGNKIRPSNV